MTPRGAQKIVFVGGLHRSGTSLLYQCLGDHPRISAFSGTGAPQDEGQHLQSVYPPAKVYGGPGRFGFDPSSFLNETSHLVSQENAKRIFDSWAQYWDLNLPYLLEKSPPNLVRARFLQALFPDAYFIILIRHPIPVSYATQKWSKTSLYNLIKHWLVCHEQFERDQNWLKRLFVLRYEDFVRTPDQIIKQICSFLGIEDFKVHREVRKDVNSKYFAHWEALYDGRLLDRLFAKYLAKVFESRVHAFGYSLRPPRYVVEVGTISME